MIGCIADWHWLVSHSDLVYISKLSSDSFHFISIILHSQWPPTRPTQMPYPMDGSGDGFCSSFLFGSWSSLITWGGSTLWAVNHHHQPLMPISIFVNSPASSTQCWSENNSTIIPYHLLNYHLLPICNPLTLSPISTALYFPLAQDQPTMNGEVLKHTCGPKWHFCVGPLGGAIVVDMPPEGHGLRWG